MEKYVLCLLALMIFFFQKTALASEASLKASELKNRIVELAKSYEGQGDPDQSKQKSLDILIEQLVKSTNVPPIKERLNLLAGNWKQIWGPYEYRKNNGGVDPTLGIYEIYQVVSSEGYYYNISPYYPDGDKSKEQIGLLRGEFKLDEQDPNGLRVKFTRYPGIAKRPEGINIWELAPIAESDQLKDKVSIVPTWVVRLFFGKGKLHEVYTDEDLRITYGSNGKADAKKTLYILKRIK